MIFSANKKLISHKPGILFRSFSTTKKEKLNEKFTTSIINISFSITCNPFFVLKVWKKIKNIFRHHILILNTNCNHYLRCWWILVKKIFNILLKIVKSIITLGFINTLKWFLRHPSSRHIKTTRKKFLILSISILISHFQWNMVFD